MSTTEFKYGWCTTDYKDGKPTYKPDYTKQKPYGKIVRKMLKQLGLPAPKKNQVYHGFRHSLLFLDSHGVVIRIGPLDVKDLINPAILQPLGWLETKWPDDKKNLPLTVAIYPGIPLSKDFPVGKEAQGAVDFLDKSGYCSLDAGATTNLGAMKVSGDDGAEYFKVLLDSDNNFNSPYDEARVKLQAAIDAETDKVDNNADLISRTIAKVFAEVSGFKGWQAVFEQHQPLRELFWRGFKDEQFDPEAQPDQEALAAFWDKCASLVNAPQTMRYPVWHIQEAAEGETPVFVREEVDIPLVLYRPWTGQDADLVKIVGPVEQPQAIKDAVAAAHAEKIGAQSKVKTPAAMKPC